MTASKSAAYWASFLRQIYITLLTPVLEILLLELHSTELSANEVSMSSAPDIFVGQINQRFECLFACLQAVKSWIDVFLSIPPGEYVGFSVCIYAKMARCLVGSLETFDLSAS